MQPINRGAAHDDRQERQARETRIELPSASIQVVLTRLVSHESLRLHKMRETP